MEWHANRSPWDRSVDNYKYSVLVTSDQAFLVAATHRLSSHPHSFRPSNQYFDLSAKMLFSSALVLLGAAVAFAAPVSGLLTSTN